MHKSLWNRAIALLLVLCMCFSFLPAVGYAADGETEAQSGTGTEEQTLEDASVQLGEYTPPAATEPVTIVTPAEEPEEPETEEPAKEEAAEEPAVPEPVRDGATVVNEGRANAGDVTLTVGGKTYILIGTKQQLEALDYYPAFVSAGSLGENSAALTDANRINVTGPIWRVKQTKAAVGWHDPSTDPNDAELVYPGDADLTGAFASYTLYGENTDLTHTSGKIVVPEGVTANGNGRKIGDTDGESSTVRYIYCRKDDNGNWVTSEYDLGKYNPKNDYVVFRSFSLSGVDWKPLMFYGTMIGVNGAQLGESTLTSPTLAAAVTEILGSRRSADYANPAAQGGKNIKQPIISDVTVSTSGKLEPSTYVGVGFFASVTSNRPGSDISFTPIRAEVRNLKLSNVSVTNGFDGIHIEQTLVNLLTGTLGKLVGKLLDVLLPILFQGTTTQYTNFTDRLSDLLAARQQDITNLATGGFAGRIDGDVLIENCDLDTVSVSSGYGYTGGFVGYSTGCEQYLPVTGPLLSILEALLNLVPGLGLGDLITIVSQVLHVNYLIPMDYLNPIVSDCDLIHLGGNVGPAKADLENADWTYTLANSIGTETPFNDSGTVRFNGGFVGCKVATQMVNCTIQDSAYTVWAGKYGGGFAGIARDAVIQELLSGLGIDLIENANVNLQSVQVRCKITNSDVTVKGHQYLGGFNGAMANAFCVNNVVNCPGKSLKVIGTGDGVGGFAGVATLGWAMNLGNQDDTSGTDLLATVSSLLTSVLGGSFNGSLLDLLGVGKSYILGLQFNYDKADGSGEEVEVTGVNCVGGLVGQADALVLSGTTSALLNEITYFEHGDLNAWDAFDNMPVQTTFTVTYKLMTGASMANGAATTATVGPNSYELTLPAANAPTGYDFEGWVTGNYDHTDVRPEGVYAAGSTILITRDTTLKALFSKQGAEAYELVLEEPDSARDWGGDYVITHNILGDDIKVLTGLANGQNYAGNTSGATAVSPNGIHVNAQYKNYLEGVTDDYVWTATRAALSGSDYYFQNKGTEQYLSLEAENIGTLLSPIYISHLYAGSRSVSESQWSLQIRTTLAADDTVGDIYALLLQSDTLNVKDYYLGYDSTNV